MAPALSKLSLWSLPFLWQDQGKSNVEALRLMMESQSYTSLREQLLEMGFKEEDLDKTTRELEQMLLEAKQLKEDLRSMGFSMPELKDKPIPELKRMLVIRQIVNLEFNSAGEMKLCPWNDIMNNVKTAQWRMREMVLRGSPLPELQNILKVLTDYLDYFKECSVKREKQMCQRIIDGLENQPELQAKYQKQLDEAVEKQKEDNGVALSQLLEELRTMKPNVATLALAKVDPVSLMDFTEDDKVVFFPQGHVVTQQVIVDMLNVAYHADIKTLSDEAARNKSLKNPHLQDVAVHVSALSDVMTYKQAKKLLQKAKEEFPDFLGNSAVTLMEKYFKVQQAKDVIQKYSQGLLQGESAESVWKTFVEWLQGQGIVESSFIQAWNELKVQVAIFKKSFPKNPLVKKLAEAEDELKMKKDQRKGKKGNELKEAQEVVDDAQQVVDDVVAKIVQLKKEFTLESVRHQYIMAAVCRDPLRIKHQKIAMKKMLQCEGEAFDLESYFARMLSIRKHWRLTPEPKLFTREHWRLTPEPKDVEDAQMVFAKCQMSGENPGPFWVMVKLEDPKIEKNEKLFKSKSKSKEEFNEFVKKLSTVFTDKEEFVEAYKKWVTFEDFNKKMQLMNAFVTSMVQVAIFKKSFPKNPLVKKLAEAEDELKMKKAQLKGKKGNELKEAQEVVDDAQQVVDDVVAKIVQLNQLRKKEDDKMQQMDIDK